MKPIVCRPAALDRARGPPRPLRPVISTYGYLLDNTVILAISLKSSFSSLLSVISRLLPRLEQKLTAFQKVFLLLETK